jgi:hypothetical protein
LACARSDGFVSGFIFGRDENGEPPTQASISVRFGRLMKKIGLSDVSHHVLRYTGVLAMDAQFLRQRLDVVARLQSFDGHPAECLRPPTLVVFPRAGPFPAQCARRQNGRNGQRTTVVAVEDERRELFSRGFVEVALEIGHAGCIHLHADRIH